MLVIELRCNNRNYGIANLALRRNVLTDCLHFLINAGKNPATWVQFNNYNEQARGECLKDYAILVNKDIDPPEALDFDTFREVSDYRAIKELRKFCTIKHSVIVAGMKKKFTCTAWLRLFEIAKPVIPEYVREFLASVYLDESITTLHQNCIWFQMGGVKHEMNMREFILAMGLYTEEEVNSWDFKDFYEYC